MCGLGCPHARRKGPSQFEREVAGRKKMGASCEPGTALPKLLVLVWAFQVLIWACKECENSEFKLGFPVLIQVYSSSRMREHILFNNLLPGFITFKYLDIWSMGLQWYSCSGFHKC